MTRNSTHSVLARSVAIPLALILISASALAACGKSSSGGSNSSGDDSAGSSTTSVSIGIVNSLANFALPDIATANKLWPKGIKVTATVLGSSALDAALATGKVDMGLTGTPSLDVAIDHSGAPVSYVAQWGFPADFQLIARPGIDTAAGLKGKSIGITTPGAATEYLSDFAMEKAGASEGQYKLITTGSAGNEATQFISGTVDAFVSTASQIQPILAQVPGSKVVYDFYTNKVPWYTAIASTYNPWAKTHKSAVVSVLQGLNAALELAHSNPQQVKPAVDKFTGTTKAAAQATQLKYLVERTPSTLANVDVSTLQSIYVQLRRFNHSSRPAASFAPKMVDNSYLAQALKLK